MMAANAENPKIYPIGDHRVSALATLPELAAGGAVEAFDVADDSDAAMPPNDRDRAFVSALCMMSLFHRR